MRSESLGFATMYAGFGMSHAKPGLWPETPYLGPIRCECLLLASGSFIFIFFPVSIQEAWLTRHNAVPKLDLIPRLPSDSYEVPWEA